MKKQFDLLASDKMPLFLIEQGKVSVKDDIVVMSNKDGDFPVPISSVMLLVMGIGSSISSEAAIMCAKNDCYIAFSRGGLNFHSIWHSGRYRDPDKLMRQVSIFADNEKKLKAAKFLFLKRLEFANELTDEMKAKIESTNNIYSLLGYEANWAKNRYRELCVKYLGGESFKRDKKSNEGVNGKLSLLNNVLYNYCTASLLCLGFDPSIGFLHGKTRRGGLTFDVADVLKTNLVLEYAFKNHKTSNQAAIRDFCNILSEKNNGIFLKIEKIMLELIEICG